MFCCFKPLRSKSVKDVESLDSRKAEIPDQKTQEADQFTMEAQSTSIFDQIPTPDPAKLNEHYILGEIVDHIEELHDDIHENFPFIDLDILRTQLIEIRNHNVNPEQHLRSFLKVYQKTPVYQVAFKQLDDTTKAQITAFIDGKSEEGILKQEAGNSTFHLPPSPPVKHHFKDIIDKVFHHDHDHQPNGTDPVSESQANGKEQKPAATGPLPVIYEDEAKTMIMEVYAETQFNNWGQTVQNTPRYTFIPKKILGLQNLVLYAKEQKLRVRVGGYRHSWSPSFSQNGEIFVSLLNLKEVTTIPDPITIGADYIDPQNELKVIQMAPGAATTGDTSLVRVGVSVTNEQFRRWAVKNDTWSLPVDVILVEVTVGGVNAPICHGAGRSHKTLSDQVRAIEYVDANGVHRTISDPEQLKAAAGSFGLLGIVTHLTLEVQKMTYALLNPSKPDIGLAIPPLDPNDVPLALRKSWTQAKLDAAQAEFERSATNDYYTEWFWFSYQKQAWVNTWNTTTDKTGAVEYPSPFDTWLQWVQNWLGGVITSSEFFQALPGRWQAQILATMSMVFLPPQDFLGQKDKKIKTALPNGLHFRRGIQNMVVRDMEFQIPIPYLSSPGPLKPDFSIIQRAWWDVINLVYQDSSSPMRLTLEMRIMSGSDMIMAPQAGNQWGTASIEVLSIPDSVTDGEWAGFCQQVADKWMNYKDDQGKSLNVRPHWAKEWEMIKMRGLSPREYLKTVAYKDQIPQFKSVLADIGKGQGWNLDDLKARFSNELWDDIVFS